MYALDKSTNVDYRLLEKSETGMFFIELIDQSIYFVYIDIYIFFYLSSSLFLCLSEGHRRIFRKAIDDKVKSLGITELFRAFHLWSSVLFFILFVLG
jgi:hypothetical protein